MTTNTLQIWEIASFIAGVLVTAIIGALISRFSERARPSVRITDITITPAHEDLEKEIPMDYTLRTRVSNNPILPELPATLQVTGIKKYLEQSQTVIAAHSIVVQHLQKIISKPKILISSTSQDEQRRCILLDWIEYGQPLEQFAHVALLNHWNEIPAIYFEPHPQQWKDPVKAKVNLTSTKDYNLREIDIESELQGEVKVKGPIGVAEPLRQKLEVMNVHRRFWIHLNEEHVRWLFAITYDLTKLFLDNAQMIVKQIEDIVAINSPEYLKVQVLISNDGNRAFAVRPFAYLQLPLSKSEGNKRVHIPLLIEEKTEKLKTTQVVKSNEALQLFYRTHEPLNTLEIRDETNNIVINGARLKSLFDGLILQCQIALSLTGFGIQKSEVVISKPYDFGILAITSIQKELTNALNKQWAG